MSEKNELKLEAEIANLMAETSKLQREANKLTNETLKLHKELSWFDVTRIVALTTGIIAATITVTKLFL